MIAILHTSKPDPDASSACPTVSCRAAASRPDFGRLWSGCRPNFFLPVRVLSRTASAFVSWNACRVAFDDKRELEILRQSRPLH